MNYKTILLIIITNTLLCSLSAMESVEPAPQQAIAWSLENPLLREICKKKQTTDALAVVQKPEEWIDIMSTAACKSINYKKLRRKLRTEIKLLFYHNLIKRNARINIQDNQQEDVSITNQDWIKEISTVIAHKRPEFTHIEKNLTLLFLEQVNEEILSLIAQNDAHNWFECMANTLETKFKVAIKPELFYLLMRVKADEAVTSSITADGSPYSVNDWISYILQTEPIDDEKSKNLKEVFDALRAGQQLTAHFIAKLLNLAEPASKNFLEAYYQKNRKKIRDYIPKGSFHDRFKLIETWTPITEPKPDDPEKTDSQKSSPATPHKLSTERRGSSAERLLNSTKGFLERISPKASLERRRKKSITSEDNIEEPDKS